MPKIFDNIDLPFLPALRNTLKVAKRADLCVGYFNLRGWRAVGDLIENWDSEGRCRLLIGMQRPPEEDLRATYRLIKRDETMDNATALRLKRALARELREQLTIGLPTNEDQAALLQLAEQLRRGCLSVKLHLRHPLHAKLYLCEREDDINPVVGYLGSSNFTLSGLQGNGELNVDILDGDACQKLCHWFNNRWEDKWSLDVSKELIEIIETSWVRPVPPYHIYLKMAYHLSREARAGQAEFEIPREFGATLFDFQIAAVKIAAHHVNKRGGVVLGDVVGLGKTLMSSAIAAIFQSPPYFLETLVICPPNLEPMWRDAIRKHRLIGDVLPLSQVHKLKDTARYRLLIIDESHNLRSGEGTRYSALKDYIQKNEPRVVLLSATPYNKHYTDLFYQLGLFLPTDKSLGIRPERFIAEVGGPGEFGAKFQTNPDTLAAFGHSLHADDWRDLMRLYLVRRTRSFIKDNYACEDKDTGRRYLLFGDGKPFYFPSRRPVTVPFPLDEKDKQDQYARLYSRQVVETINDLHLPRYGLGNYIDAHFAGPISDEEAQLLGNLSRAGKRLMGFCRTNLFKRLESSGAAFLLSLERHILRNCIFLHALENDLPLPIGTQDALLLDTAFNDEDEEASGNSSGSSSQASIPDWAVRAKAIYDLYRTQSAKRFKWPRSALFQKGLAEHLRADNAALQGILNLAGAWDAARDAKLAALRKLLCETHASEKVLVFSQFADTVRYLSRELEGAGLTRLCGVTGTDKDPTAIARRFSPQSNGIKLPETEQLRVLLATDVLSEGQNLQDGHVIINFDLPWAIIRLIQRAGRVDRIGQQAPEILCYSFLPAEGVEKIISLRGRLSKRLKQNAEVIGTDEAFFQNSDEQNLLDLYSEKAHVLESDDGGEVDLSSHAFQIWKNATDADPQLRKTIPGLPNVVFGAKKPNGTDARGALVYVRTPGDNDTLAWVADDGKIVTQSPLRVLQAASCDAGEKGFDMPEHHHALVAAGVEAAIEAEKNIGGGLGKPSGARYKAYHVLKRYHESVKNSLFDTPDLSKIADALYRAPLRQSAVDKLNAQFRIGAPDESIVRLLSLLHEEENLVHSADDEPEESAPRLICSLGLV